MSIKTQCPTCGELNKSMREYCENCGANLTRNNSQFSVSGNGEPITGTVSQSARGYYIILTQGEASHTLTQKKVKEYEERTGFKRETLAKFLAEHTSSVRFDFNGKYGTSSAHIDIRTEEEKQQAERRIAIWQAEEKKKEEEKQKFNQRGYEMNIGKIFTITTNATGNGYNPALINGIKKFYSSYTHPEERDLYNTISNIARIIFRKYGECKISSPYISPWQQLKNEKLNIQSEEGNKRFEEILKNLIVK